MKRVIFACVCACTGAAVLALSPSPARSGGPASAAHRIRFAPGATHRTVRVRLSNRLPRPVYTVKTRAGQHMVITVEPTAPSRIVPDLNVVSPSGTASEENYPKARRVSVPRTEKGEYRIRIGVNQMATQDVSGVCRLRVSVR